jgi:hypothetical protein
MTVRSGAIGGDAGDRPQKERPVAIWHGNNEHTSEIHREVAACIPYHTSSAFSTEVLKDVPMLILFEPKWNVESIERIKNIEIALIIILLCLHDIAECCTIVSVGTVLLPWLIGTQALHLSITT